MPAWCRQEAGNKVLLALHVQPGARRTELAGLHGEALKIRLAAPPVDGKANAALLRFLAQTLDIPRSQIVIRSGESSRQKLIELHEVTLHRVESLLNPASPTD